MKIRIEGCTRECLVPYLLVGKDYEVTERDGRLARIRDEDGENIYVLLEPSRCAFLPSGARWVEVTNEKAPS